MQELVGNAKAVVERFGAWPDFRGSEVDALMLWRDGRCLRLHLFVPHGGQVHRVTFLFQDVAELELAGWDEGNALSTLAMEEAEGAIRVRMESAGGMRCAFVCGAAEVERA